MSRYRLDQCKSTEHGRQTFNGWGQITLMKIVFWLTVLIGASTSVLAKPTIVVEDNAPPMVRLAANEVQRYVYLRTGEALPIAETGKGMTLKIDPSLGAQEYKIMSDSITGGSAVGVLYRQTKKELNP